MLIKIAIDYYDAPGGSLFLASEVGNGSTALLMFWFASRFKKKCDQEEKSD
jgi:hypothetical protein